MVIHYHPKHCSPHIRLQGVLITRQPCSEIVLHGLFMDRQVLHSTPVLWSLTLENSNSTAGIHKNKSQAICILSILCCWMTIRWETPMQKKIYSKFYDPHRISNKFKLYEGTSFAYTLGNYGMFAYNTFWSALIFLYFPYMTMVPLRW
jgi:hypothetical protein